MLNRSLIVTAACVACGLTVIQPATADSLFPYLDDAPPKATSTASVPTTPWQTSVIPAAAPIPETKAIARPAPSQLGRTVTAADITTGAISRSQLAAHRQPKLSGTPHALNGLASFYSQGEVTANGEPFDKRAMTAAHKTLPFGTKVRVTRLDTGSDVVVRINDRGPFKPGRVIDLSESAAEHIGLTSAGLTAVRLEVIGK